MANNIGCFAAGCNNTVIGQCSGYRGNCGQFYCHSHSAGKLCSECGGRKHRDEVLEDYLTAAGRISAQESDTADNILIILILISIVGGVVVLATSGFVASLGWFISWLVLSAPFFFYSLHKTGNVQKAVAANAQTKPGFRRFYQAYKKAEQAAKTERSRQQALEMLGAVVGGTIAGIGNAVNEAGKAMATPPPAVIQGTPRDVERAIQSLEKTIVEQRRSINI